MTPARILQICLLFGSSSLLSFGGGNAVIPEIQLKAVHTYGWITAEQFSQAFAIAQAAPGPSTLLVSAIGYQAGGIPGALLATAAMILPAWILVYVAARFWLGAKRSPLRIAIEEGLAPVAIGLILASAIVIALSTDHGPMQYVLTAIATVVFCTVKLNPLWVMGACGLAGWAFAL